MVDSMLIVTSIVGFCIDPCFIVRYFMCNHLGVEERAGCFA